MPKTVKAIQGQALCQLAMEHGFLNCDPIRASPGNAGKDFLNRETLREGEEVEIPDVKTKQVDAAIDKSHTFKVTVVPPPLLRFTHGTPDKPYREDPDQDGAGISNFPTNKAGANVKSAFPSGTRFNQLGHDDEDAFKIEVVDPSKAKAKTCRVQLLALKPKTAGGKVQKDPATGRVLHEEFGGAEQAERQNTITLEAVPSKVCFRSPYLRLVVDKRDRDAVKKQTLMLADMTDGKGGDADAVEPLDQLVRARYTIDACKQGKKCRLERDLQVLPEPGDRKRVKIAMHILVDPTTGLALSTDEQVRRTLLMYMRQVYAQAGLSIKLLGSARTVVAPANMLVVSDQLGRKAAGGGTVTVRVRIADLGFDQSVTVTTVKDHSTEDTANLIRSELDKVLPPTVKARVSRNPPIFGRKDDEFSTDLLVGDPLVNQVRLTVTASTDARQTVQAVALTSAVFPTGSGNERHVGNIFSRILLKNYDTGRDRIDLFVVGNMPGLLGLAFNPFVKYGKAKYGHGPSRDDIANSFIVNVTTLHTPGVPENFYTTIPHEIGHVLTDAIHALNRPTELMGPGSPVGADERQVGGCKRITDRQKVAHDDGISDVPVTMFRDNNPDPFTTWDDV
jgi:hypothetical protein